MITSIKKVFFITGSEVSVKDSEGRSVKVKGLDKGVKNTYKCGLLFRVWWCINTYKGRVERGKEGWMREGGSQAVSGDRWSCQKTFRNFVNPS